MISVPYKQGSRLLHHPRIASDMAETAAIEADTDAIKARKNPPQGTA
jgi:hypothetical protein